MFPTFYNISTCAAIAFLVGALLPPRSRPQALTAVMSPLFSVFAVGQWFYWMNTGDLISGIDTIVYLEMMKTYILVDIVYRAVVDIRRIPLLSGWLYAGLYYYIADQLLADHQDGIVRPFMIAELSTAVFTWGEIVPSLRNDRFFGSVFCLTRILLPIVYLPILRFTDFNWGVLCLVIAANVYWFGRWIAQQQ
jgi:hypothetical protein